MNTAVHDPLAAVVPGWFGKLACLGDFASRRLPPEFLRACDTWLSRGVEASRARLGERWLDTYLTGPLWRFAWAPDVVDARWWFGVMMPSVDNVGRYFPLLVALPHADAPHCGAAVDALERWFGEVSQAALGTLQPAATLDRFEYELHAAIRLEQTGRVAPPHDQRPQADDIRRPPPEGDEQSGKAAFADGRPQADDIRRPPPEGDEQSGKATFAHETHWSDRTGYSFAPGHTLRQSLHDLAHRDAAQRYRGCTLWWSLRSRGGDNRLTVATGLPAADSFADLLQGAW